MNAVLAALGHDIGWRIFAAAALVALGRLIRELGPDGRPWP